MSNKTFLSISYDELTDRYRAETYIQSKAKDWKYLTNDEAEALSSYTGLIEDGSVMDVPVTELIEQIESGEIILEEDSFLLELLWEAYDAR